MARTATTFLTLVFKIEIELIRYIAQQKIPLEIKVDLDFKRRIETNVVLISIILVSIKKIIAEIFGNDMIIQEIV